MCGAAASDGIQVVFKRSSDNAESKQIDTHNSALWTVATNVVLDIIRADAACDNFHRRENYLEAIRRDISFQHRGHKISR